MSTSSFKNKTMNQYMFPVLLIGSVNSEKRATFPFSSLFKISLPISMHTEEFERFRDHRWR
jgi:hypothetical protein